MDSLWDAAFGMEVSSAGEANGFQPIQQAQPETSSAFQSSDEAATSALETEPGFQRSDATQATTRK